LFSASILLFFIHPFVCSGFLSRNLPREKLTSFSLGNFSFYLPFNSSQYKRVYWPEQKRYIRLRISTKAIKTLNKVGLEKMAKDAGLDLMSLAYQQADEARAEWLAANADEEPTRKDKRAPTGPKKLFIPKWKEARMSKLSPEAKDAETKRFAEKYNMTLA